MVYPNEKIRPPFLGAYELFICPSNHLPPLLLPRCILSPRDFPIATMPSVAEFMHNHHVERKGFCSKTNRIFLYFFTCHHCLNILIYTFKGTGKSSSICMTAGDDNDEGAFFKPYILHSIRFQSVCLCMSMYMLELSVELYILHEGTNIRVSTISVPTVLQVAF